MNQNLDSNPSKVDANKTLSVLINRLLQGNIQVFVSIFLNAKAQLDALLVDDFEQNIEWTSSNQGSFVYTAPGAGRA